MRWQLGFVCFIGCVGACADDGYRDLPIDPSLPFGTPTTAATLAGCRVFPDDDAWNLDVSQTQLHPKARRLHDVMNPTRRLHPDWGNWSTDHYGIPWESGTGAPDAPITWTASWGNDESDPRACAVGGTTYPFCYPIPQSARIEGGLGASPGSDRHVLYLDTAGAPDHCMLYELYQVQNRSGLAIEAANGAIFDLGSSALRTEGFTSADAAGLPILPGLVRYEEVAAGEIRHAIRFTMSRTANGHIHPATHHAGNDDPNLPPMGLRVRLRADYPETGVSPEAAVILRAMKKYGMILADNGSDWFFSGDSDDRWDAVMDGILSAMGDVTGGDFEAVYTGPTITP